MDRHEARFWDKAEENKVRCLLCPHRCIIADGKSGVCRVRVNREGVLYTLNYGEIGAIALDPIEKKPLYHFYPGMAILSVGTVGCNLSCGFCQNYELVVGDVPRRRMDHEEVVQLAEEVRSRGNIGIAYTYSEPLVWYEFVADTARLARKRALKNVLVTNGFVEEEPLLDLLPYVDAVNIDLKSFKDEFYRKTCKGRLAPVMRTIEICSRRTHVEVTTLLIPGLNDSPEEISQLAGWLASISPDIVLHLSRYHPAREFNLPPTPATTMHQARETARQYLKHVYLGNLGSVDNNTYCRDCGNLLVERSGYYTGIKGVREGKCSGCGGSVPIVGDQNV